MTHHRWLGFMLAAALAASSAPCSRTSSPQDQIGSTEVPSQPVDLEVAKIRSLVRARLAVTEPELYRRNLESILAMCEDAALTARIAGPGHSHEDELLGYLKAIESGLSQPEVERSASYLQEGMRDLIIARISQLDGTMQVYTVRLPLSWDPHKAYPLWVQLHGRWSDLPLALVANKLGPASAYDKRDDDAIILTPWVRGNSDYRLKYGSEPDIWEAIDDVKTFATLDPDRWYISGHSWGGDDTWSIVLRTPDLWAAAGIMAGHPHGVPDQEGLVANASYVPFYLWRGSIDPTPNRQWALEYFRDSLTAVGDPPKVVIASGVPHMYRPQDIDAMERWLFQYRRQRPDKFSFVIDTPEHRGVWGISVPVKYEQAYFDVEPKASFKCEIKGSTVRIETTNTNRIDVDLGAHGLSMSGRVTLFVNGRQMFEGSVPDKSVNLTW